MHDPTNQAAAPPARLLYGPGSTTAVNVTVSESIPAHTGALPPCTPAGGSAPDPDEFLPDTGALPPCTPAGGSAPRPRMNSYPGY